MFVVIYISLVLAQSKHNNQGLVAQWIRAFPCGGKGRAFESHRGHHTATAVAPFGVAAAVLRKVHIWGGDGAVERARLENELG